MTWKAARCIGIFLAFGRNWTKRRNPLKKRFLSENVIFRGLRLSLGHFGQQAPESPVSQLQNGVSTSSLPPFIVVLSTFKDYTRSNSFFQWEFLGVLKGKPRERLSMGRNSSTELVAQKAINRYLWTLPFSLHFLRKL